MKRVAVLVAVVLLIPLHMLSLRQASAGWDLLPRPESSSFVLPAPIAKLVSLEFDGLVADFMFLESLVFWGRVLERPEFGSAKFRKADFEYMHASLEATTDLDPHFLDPYLLGQAVLTWEGGMYQEANALLSKAERYRDWDWEPPFYKGFNYFYFLKDNEQASESLMRASEKPDAFPLFASLATRLAVKSKQTENAIIFLDQLLRSEEDPLVREKYETRLAALKKILFLERAVGLYVTVKGDRPASLQNLVDEGFIERMPKDPYGGIFYITPEGEIKTTSNLQFRD